MKLKKRCKCCELCGGRTHVVPPEGDPNSPIAFVGEAPGETEDREGRPFVGRAGKVLNKVLEEEGLPREKVLITNTVKCRPPGNRTPRVEEMQACFPHLEQELKKTKVIVALGRTAAKDFLGRDVKLGEEVNRIMKIEIMGKTKDLIVAYHPAAYFYNPKVKDSLKETVRLVKSYASS
jgi:uracil-DNA glycosylase family 4